LLVRNLFAEMGQGAKLQNRTALGPKFPIIRDTEHLNNVNLTNYFMQTIKLS
jgi:hypothetical protein